MYTRTHASLARSPLSIYSLCSFSPFHSSFAISHITKPAAVTAPLSIPTAFVFYVRAGPGEQRLPDPMLFLLSPSLHPSRRLPCTALPPLIERAKKIRNTEYQMLCKEMRKMIRRSPSFVQRSPPTSSIVKPTHGKTTWRPWLLGDGGTVAGAIARHTRSELCYTPEI